MNLNSCLVRLLALIFLVSIVRFSLRLSVIIVPVTAVSLELAAIELMNDPLTPNPLMRSFRRQSSDEHLALKLLIVSPMFRFPSSPTAEKDRLWLVTMKSLATLNLRSLGGSFARPKTFVITLSRLFRANRMVEIPMVMGMMGKFVLS